MNFQELNLPKENSEAVALEEVLDKTKFTRLLPILEKLIKENKITDDEHYVLYRCLEKTVKVDFGKLHTFFRNHSKEVQSFIEDIIISS